MRGFDDAAGIMRPPTTAIGGQIPPLHHHVRQAPHRVPWNKQEHVCTVCRCRLNRLPAHDAFPPITRNTEAAASLITGLRTCWPFANAITFGKQPRNTPSPYPLCSMNSS